MKCKEMGDSSFKNHRPFRILAFSLQLLSENKEHIEGNIQHLGNFIFRRSLKKVSSIKEISYDFSSFIKENVVSLHPD
jgi:hypothetical protein